MSSPWQFTFDDDLSTIEYPISAFTAASGPEASDYLIPQLPPHLEAHQMWPTFIGDLNVPSPGRSFSTTTAATSNLSNSSTRVNSPNSLTRLDEENKNGKRGRSQSQASADQGKTKKRPKTEAELARIKEVRETGACIHCQKNRRECLPGPDPDGPCGQCCKKMAIHKHANSIAPVLCWKVKIIDVNVFRDGPTKKFAATLRWFIADAGREDGKDLWKAVEKMPRKPRSQTPNSKKVQLSQGHVNNTLNILVQQYSPEEGDQQDYTWKDGDGTGTYHCEPYGIADVDFSRRAINKFIDDNKEGYVHTLLQETNNFSRQITTKVFRYALRNPEESPLVEQALWFWVAGRLIETPWHIVGDERLGMKPNTNPRSPYYKKTPVTPMMDFQIDNIAINHELKRLLKELRNTLKKKLLAMKKEDWFEIHVTLFILLNHVELTTAHDVEFAEWHRHRCPYRYSNQPLIDMITHGANTLLHYWQYANSYVPFTAPNFEDVRRDYRFTKSQESLILAIREMLTPLRASPIALQPGDELFWSSQMYQERWEARAVMAQVV